MKKGSVDSEMKKKGGGKKKTIKTKRPGLNQTLQRIRTTPHHQGLGRNNQAGKVL